MFCRTWVGLPPDAQFPSGLKQLGYFVNDEDEIRSIANPDYYFNYFLDKNSRVNIRQRFEFDAAARSIIHDRLEAKGLVKTAVPPLAAGSEANHVPIFTSKNLKDAEHVIFVFGEHAKDLGVIASRVISGAQGINKGSMVSVVEAIQRDESTAIVLANMGESYWWPDGKRAITVAGSTALQMPSLVHMGTKYHAPLNDIPGSESPLCHARTVLDSVLDNEAQSEIRVSIIALGDSCETIVKLLDEDEAWNRWGARLTSALFCNPAFCKDIQQPGLKVFLAKRTRGYLLSDQPLDTPLAGPEGDQAGGVPPFGFPCYSAGEPAISELTFVSALEPALAYLKEVSVTPNYENPAVVLARAPHVQEMEDAWAQLGEDERPKISTEDPEKLQKQVKNLRKWRQFEETGYVPDSDSDSGDDGFEEENDLPVFAWPETS